jgi:ribonuclease HI
MAKAPGTKYLSSAATTNARLRLDSFLAGLKWLKPEELISFFGKNTEFVDASGQRWNREEIWRGLGTLFAPYAKRNATYVVEAIFADTGTVFVANVLWKNALLASEQRAWVHRMNIVLLPGTEEWEIILAQVTPVQFF